VPRGAGAGGAAGQAGLEQGAERGDVLLDGAGRRGTARSPTSPLGRSTTVSGLSPPDGQADPVRLGDALGEPAQHGARLRSSIGPLEPLGERPAPRSTR
jgi:hypothetical protein